MLQGQRERRIEIAEALRELLAVVNSHRTLDDILGYVLERAIQLLGSDAGLVYLLESGASDGFLHIAAARGLSPDRIAQRVRIGSPVSGLAVQRRRPVAFVNLAEVMDNEVGPDTAPLVDDLSSHLVVRRIGSLLSEPSSIDSLRRLASTHPAALSVPLIARDEVYGALGLFYRQSHQFSDADVELASAFANQTALIIENARLNQRSEERAGELEALYRADEALHRSLRLDDVLQALCTLAADILHADKTVVWTRADEQLIVVRAGHGISPQFRAETLTRAEAPIIAEVAGNDIVAVEDVRTDPRMSARLRQRDAREGVQAWLGATLRIGDLVFGSFAAGFANARTFDFDERRVLSALAQRAALAIQNANLYEQAQRTATENARLRDESERRALELEALYRADETLHRSLRLGDVLQALVDVATEVLRSDKSTVLVWDDAHVKLIPGATRGFQAETVARLTHVPGQGITGLVAQGGRTIAVPDTLLDPRVEPTFADLEGIRALIHAPIMVEGAFFGLFGVHYCAPRVFTDHEQRLLQSLAQRAALAIHNARLYEQAQQAATLDERQRLARELHDAVTQTLFSASLIADALPHLREHRPEEVAPRLEQLRQLSRGALAEMRTLLVELRPAALIEIPLGDLLKQLVEATTARVSTRLTFEVHGSPSPLPADVQVGLYRLTQEALNNVAKHAAAAQAGVTLGWDDEHVRVRVSDDGRGFDPTVIAAGHMGVAFMRERAAGIGALLDVASQPGSGTVVTIAWPRLV